MKKIAVYSLVGLFVLSCSVSTPNNSTRDTSFPSPVNFHPLLVKDNFAELEKEYKSFSTKALSDAYVSRMFTKFLVTTPNPVQVIRQLEFARYLKDVKSDSGYFNSLTGIISNDSSIYTKINTMPEVVSYKTANSATFGAFVNSLNPVQAPVVPAGFKLVEKGTFNMGMAGIAEPVHTVTFTKDLYMGEKEVTQGEWASVYDAVTTTPDLRTRMGSRDPSFFPNGGNNDNLPIEYVSWLNAIAYCNAKSIKDGLHVAYNPATGAFLKADGVTETLLTTEVEGYRLPTEAEWEYAARGGKDNWNNGNIYPGADGTIIPVGNVAWYYIENSELVTHLVGTKSSNELGLFDMGGNVTEYVQDYYSVYTGNTTTTPFPQNPYISSGDSSRMFRGGSFVDDPSNVGSAYRSGASPQEMQGDATMGFRVARSVL